MKPSPKAKTDRVNLGIAIAHATCQPGQSRSLRDIAVFCECDRNAIFLIEQKALRKLRNRLQFANDPLLRDVIGHLLTR